jgi:hypothetical protein
VAKLQVLSSLRINWTCAGKWIHVVLKWLPDISNWQSK